MIFLDLKYIYSLNESVCFPLFASCLCEYQIGIAPHSAAALYTAVETVLHPELHEKVMCVWLPKVNMYQHGGCVCVYATAAHRHGVCVCVCVPTA